MMTVSRESLERSVQRLENAAAHSAHELEIVKSKLSEEMQAREGLEETARKFSTAVEQCPAAVVVTSTTGAIEYVNPKFVHITGYESEEVLGKNPRILKSGETSKEEYRRLWETIREGGEWTGEFHNRRKSGELFWERATISGIRDKNGVITHYLAVKEDITKYKEKTRELEEQKLKYLHQAKMAEIGLLTAGILHEVGNPIASIRGLVSEISDLNGCVGNPPLAKRTCDNLELIKEHTDRLLSITREISDFISPQPGEYALLDLNSLIRNTSRLLRYDQRWGRLQMNLELDAALPALNAIKDQICHVIMNLLVNAADAVAEYAHGDPTITIETRHIGGHLDMIVEDNGKGMDQKTMEHACEAFYTTKPNGKGTGLGLSVCHSIVSGHNGSIGIESSANRGTRIVVSLPVDGQIHKKEAG